MNTVAVAAVIKAMLVAFVPPAPMYVDEWADKYRWIPQGASARPGKWVTRGYQSEPMRVMSPQHPAQMVILMCASQVLKTEAIVNKAGHTIHIDPAPMLIVEPRDLDASKLSRSRLDPMIAACPELRERVGGGKSRTADNATWQKRFPGGELLMVGAQTPSNLAMMAVRDLMLDEVDRFPANVGEEGDPIFIALARTKTYGASAKVVMASSPTSSRISRIFQQFQRSDRRYYHVPCPSCGHFQPLRWGRVTWGILQNDSDVFDDPASTLRAGDAIPIKQAMYRCESCDVLIPHWRKRKMVELGKWVAENPESEVPGFQLSRLYAPEGVWGELAQQFERAEGSPSQLRAFYNTILGLPWDEGDATPDVELLFHRQLRDVAVNWAVQLPRGPLFLTGAIDVQANRIEWLVMGWDDKLRRWCIEHQVIPGDTKEDKVWEDLSSSIRKKYRHASGMPIEVSVWAIDHNFNSHKVEEWARRQSEGDWPVDVIMVYGSRSPDANDGILGAPRSLNTHTRTRIVMKSATTYPVNTHRAKSELYAALNQKSPAPDSPIDAYPRFWCFYANQGMEFFRQLTAETFVVQTDRNGFPVGRWVKSQQERNEILDLHGYARAGVEYLRAAEWSSESWETLRAKYDNFEQGLQQEQRSRRPDESDSARGWIPRKKGWLS